MRLKKADEGEKERKKQIKPKSLEEHRKMSAAKGT
jgi:hypothetical protein